MAQKKQASQDFLPTPPVVDTHVDAHYLCPVRWFYCSGPPYCNLQRTFFVPESPWQELLSDEMHTTQSIKLEESSYDASWESELNLRLQFLGMLSEPIGIAYNRYAKAAPKKQSITKKKPYKPINPVKTQHQKPGINKRRRKMPPKLICENDFIYYDRNDLATDYVDDSPRPRPSNSLSEYFEPYFSPGQYENDEDTELQEVMAMSLLEAKKQYSEDQEIIKALEMSRLEATSQNLEEELQKLREEDIAAFEALEKENNQTSIDLTKKEQYVQCPVCGNAFLLESINNHIDQCLALA